MDTVRMHNHNPETSKGDVVSALLWLGWPPIHKEHQEHNMEYWGH